MYNFLLLIVLFYSILSCFSIPLSYIFFFPHGLCVVCLATFSIPTKSCLISVSFFPINLMSQHVLIHSVVLYQFLHTTRNQFYTSYHFFLKTKLNNICDRVTLFQSCFIFKKGDSVPSILTVLLVFCTHVLNIFINFGGILYSSIHFHSVSLCIESYAF